MLSDVDRPEPGELFEGRYEILAEIGAGSFGRVYKARQLSTGQAVALKMLRPQGDDGDADGVSRARFRREMQLSAQLSHPNIVSLVDSGELGDGRLYAVFEFVSGLTLRELLERDGRLEPVEAIRLMTQVLDALSSAHALGVVHRDLKPENVMVTETGALRNALVLDFGLGGFTSTEQLTDARRLTATREMMGTPCYAAPEQLRGERPTPASDLYSWGLVFLECLTGEVAVDGATAYEVLARQLGTDPVPIPAWVRREAFGHLLERVTAKDVDRREASASDVLAMLSEAGMAVAQSARAAAAGPTTGEKRQLAFLAIGAKVRRADGRALGPDDLEDLADVLGPHHERVTALVEQQGGILLDAKSDRHVAMFGYPSMGNDTLRAGRAALRLAAVSRDVSRMLEAERALLFDVSMGLHADVVIVRKTLASTGDAAYEVIGPAPNVASKLEGAAPPGEVLASATTEQLFRDEMQCEPAPRLAEQGIEAVRVVADRPPTLTPSAAAKPDAPLIERAVELEQLRALWQRARDGTPAALLIAGDAGIGKSRLVHELRRSVPADSWLECRCVPEATGSPLRPIVDLLRALREPIEDVLARHHFDPATAGPLFRSLLGSPPGEPPEPTGLAPDHQKELTIEHLVRLLIAMADAHPLVFVVEDLHWADPTTLEVLTRLVSTLASAGAEAAVEPLHLLFLATARPSFVAPWNATDAMGLRLGRLSPKGVAEFVQTILGSGRPADADLVNQIAERTDGVPLFIEEVMHALGPKPEADGLPVGIPATIRELLTARLDALSRRARTTVQLAAAVGREFPWSLLAAASDDDETQLRRDLHEVMDAALLHQRRSTATERYVFRHSLLRDAAYESMTRATRARVHRRIASAIESRFPEVAAEQPELLALHLESGRAPMEAVTYWQRAADRALRRAAYQEATGALDRALALLAKEPPSSERLHGEIEALTTLGTVQFSTQGYAAPDVEATFAKAQSLCVENEIDASPKILSGIIGVHITRSDREATQALLPRFRRMADAPRDVVDAVTGWTALAIDAFWRGAHDDARGYLDRARPVYRTDEFHAYAREYGYDGGIFSYAYSVWNEWMLGRASAAEATYAELLALAENSFDPYSIPLALCFGMALAEWRDDVGAMRERATQLVARASEQKLYLWLAVGMCGLGGVATRDGKPAEAVAQIHEGLQLSKTIGDMASYGVYLTYLASAHAAASETEKGLRIVDEGLALCARSLGRFHEPELQRWRGVLELQRDDASAAEQALRTAIGTASEHGAVAWRLRSTNTLARMLCESGRRPEGVALVRDALAGLPSDVDVGELTEARALVAGA